MINRREQGHGSQEIELRPRSFGTLLIIAVCAALLFSGFAALGTWQLQRLQWKRALIERVEQRVHAAPVEVPPPERWAQVSAESDEYRRVQVTGVFLHELATKVQATTVLGSGHWILTPLRTSNGNVILVNRGFVPIESRGATSPTQHGSTQSALAPQANSEETISTVTGLLRMSEPGGGFLRSNDPAADRWYSRDVHAIAEARGLSSVAPYFIDADKSSKKQSERGVISHPIGGLTVISFPNNHLVYAITWYALAFMVAAASLWVAWDERRVRRTASRFHQ